MKKLYLIARLVGLLIFAPWFYYIIRPGWTNTDRPTVINSEVEKTWTDLEKAAPIQAKAYRNALSLQGDLKEEFSARESMSILIGFPLCLILTSLIWQFTFGKYYEARRIKRRAERHLERAYMSE